MTNSDSVQTIAITGVTGFIGQQLLMKLESRTGINIRALTRQLPEHAFSMSNNRLYWVCGDLADSSTAANLLIPNSILINLAFPESWPCSAHIESTKRLADAAANCGVRRVIHCSTAAVIGKVRQQSITEATEPLPQTEYEQTKLAIERTWQTSASGRFDLVIARPSAVFGAGGKNLIKLADALLQESKYKNYVRSVLYSRRKMNLVHVRNVVDAIVMLMDRGESFIGNIFNISDDDDPYNNFRDVERILMRELGVSGYALPPLSAPPFALAALLHMAGRSNTNPERVYDCTKLQQLGWRSSCDIDQGLRDFATWYLAHRRSA